MKPDDAIESITRFFNDLIGAIVPSSVLAIGLVVLHLGPGAVDEFRVLDGAMVGLCVLGALFALGHAILSLHEHALMPLLAKLKVVKVFDVEDASKRSSFKLFERIIQENPKLALKNDDPRWGFNDLRSVALTASPAAEGLGRRFMFISLLCNGTGTALLVLAVDFLVSRLCAPDLLAKYSQAPHWVVQIVLLIVAALLLFKRAESFHSRAMNTPFAVAVSGLAFETKKSDA